MPSLTEVAYHEIKKSILVGKMPPGHKLVINDLVDEWKISNTPIKEALNRLVTEGLVETIPRRGMRVRIFSAKDLREIFEIRTIIESHCCGVAVTVVDKRPEVILELQGIVEQMRAVADNEFDYDTQYELDKSFHTAIVNLCGNDMLIKEFERLHANVLSYMISASRQMPLVRQKKAFTEHNRILNALRMRSKPVICRAIEEHLLNTSRDIVNYL